MKKDILNSVVAIALMLLVGGCMTVILVYSADNDDLRSLKPKKEKNKIQSSDSLVVNNNQTRTGVNLPDSIK